MGVFIQPQLFKILSRASRLLALTAIVSQLWLHPSTATAQSLNYIDEAGNIHFVESLNDVPQQYRNQFIPAQPTLQPGSRAAKEYDKTIKIRERELEREKKKKEKEEARKKKLEEREKKKKEKEESKKKKKKSSKDSSK